MNPQEDVIVIGEEEFSVNFIKYTLHRYKTKTVVRLDGDREFSVAGELSIQQAAQLIDLIESAFNRGKSVGRKLLQNEFRALMDCEATQ